MRKEEEAMDFTFSEREEMLRKTVREFAENEVPPKMPAMEETGKFPMELLEPMAQLGILGVITPPEFDGVGLGYVARTIVLEELGRVCGAMPMAIQVHHMGSAAINDFGTDEQKKKYLPPWPKERPWGWSRSPTRVEDRMWSA
jgi:alkylation response protein AidB-like acyl-CoA dehydrogenase